MTGRRICGTPAVSPIRGGGVPCGQPPAAQANRKLIGAIFSLTVAFPPYQPYRTAGRADVIWGLYARLQWFRTRNGFNPPGRRPTSNWNMTDKIPISGLKLSEPLVAVWLQAPVQQPDPMAGLCDLLSRNHINIAYMTSAGFMDDRPILVCIDARDQTQAHALVAGEKALASMTRFGEPVGLLTFYPHHASLTLLGLSLQLLSENGIQVLGVASSISALTFVVDLDRLDDAAHTLLTVFELPPNAAPLRADFIVRQTPRTG